MRTVLDGYNLLLRDRDPDSAPLQDLREEFLRRVDAARTPGQLVTVVFDGQPGHRSAAAFADGLEVRYSRSPRTADDLIVTLVRKGHRGQTVVLTHDRELGHRVREAGGRVGDPAEFFRRPRSGSSPKRPREKPAAPKGSEIDAWERLFREGEEDA